MKFKPVFTSIILIFVFLITACSPQTADSVAMPDPTQETGGEAMEDKSDEMMTDQKSDEMASEEMASDKMASDEMASDSDDMTGHSDDAKMEEGDDEMGMKADEMSGDPEMAPDWFTVELVETRSGDVFTISDTKGKVVLVETLAMWCSNCLKQQGQVKALHEMIGERDDFISLGIDIDPNENAEALKSYISGNGFDWRYTVAPREVAREIGQLYGDQFLNPSSTPMLIIDRHGEVHLLPFGIKSAESLLDALQPFLDDNM